jgi:hypothetical protein
VPREKIDRDGYRVRRRDEFLTNAGYQHYIKAYKIIDARPSEAAPGRRRPRHHTMRVEKVFEAVAQGLINRASSPSHGRPVAEVRAHIAVCMTALGDSPVHFDRFKWFKRNLYKALRYSRGYIREEALLDFVDDWLIRILEHGNVYIPPPRQLVSQLRTYGEKYGG